MSASGLTLGTGLALRRPDMDAQTTTPVIEFKPLARDRMTPYVVLAMALAAGAVLLPPRGLALLLTGGRPDLLDSATAGVWIFKALLAVHASLLILAGRMRLYPTTSEPLLAEIPVLDGARTHAREWTILAVVLVLGAALRLHALGEGLWHDEISALVQYARLPAGAILTTYDSQNQHMLYSLLAHASVTAFGESAWAMRLPAALFGVASIWAAYWFGKHITVRREALLTATLLAVSYHHIWFSQNARGYSALLFGILLSSGLFLQLLRERETFGWSAAIPYAVVTALAIYTQISAVFVTVAHFLIWAVLIVRARQRTLGAPAWMPLAAFVLAATLSLQFYAFALPQFLQTVSTPTVMAGVAIEWKNPLWFMSEMVRGLTGGLPGGAVLLIIGAIVGAAGMVSYSRRSGTVVAVMLLPVAITAIGMLVTAHNLWPRLFFFAAGFAVLIAVRGVFALAEMVAARRAPVLATAALAGLIAASAATTPRAWGPKQDYAGAHAFVERERGADDAVVIVDMSRFTYERYILSGWTAVESVAELEAIERSHPKTWVVYTFPARLSALQPEIWNRLERFYTQAGRFQGTLGGGDIVVKVLENKKSSAKVRDQSLQRRDPHMSTHGIV